MALPIWAKFLQKVYADQKLGLKQSAFEMPAGITKRLDCDENDDDQNVQEEEEFF